MRRAGLPLLALSLLSTGCAYHNVIHNAEGLFRAGEVARRSGQDSLAAVHYGEVVRKTGTAYRDRPDSDWACDALILLGRSHLRLGYLRAARAAFEQVGGDARSCRRSEDMEVYLAVVMSELGNGDGALARVNRALQGPLSAEAAAEAHLLRGRLLLERSLVEHGEWDLDRATAIDEGARTAAGLAGLRWSMVHGDRERARRAVKRLYSYPEAAAQADSVAFLASRAAELWSPSEAAALLEPIRKASWDRMSRDRLALHRATLLHASGDTAEARRETFRVASGLGEVAAEARLQLARWRLADARDLREVQAVRALLLPAGADPRVAEKLVAIADLEAFADAGIDQPLGWFAAGEVARDRLGADIVARGLFLAYADAAPDDPWAAKALLAALALAQQEGERSWLRSRLEAHGHSPYVLAALGGSATGFEALEEELELRLGELSRK